MKFINPITEIGVTSFLDIAFMTLLIYTVIIAFKRTRAAFVLTGIFIMAFIYLVTRQFNLVLTASVFEKFFAVILVILVVIFQEELKHFFEEIAIWSFNRRFLKKRAVQLSREEVATLVRSVMDFAREHIGALIVIRGKNILDRHLDGEVDLNGELSEPLLKSLFDPHSIGHDGAVVIDGDRITHFACHLPLSRNLSKIKNKGTRHAAALGISELTDCLCLVVSEEQGTVSMTRNGQIQAVENPEKLSIQLQKFYDEISPTRIAKPWEDFFKRNTWEKAYALLLALGLWFVLVYGAKVTYKSFVIPVSHAVFPSEWTITEVDPPEVEVTFRGPRTAFFFLLKDQIKLYMDLKMQKGNQRLRVYTDNFTYPKQLVLEDYEPKYIKVILDKAVKEEKGAVKIKDAIH